MASVSSDRTVRLWHGAGERRGQAATILSNVSSPPLHMRFSLCGDNSSSHCVVKAAVHCRGTKSFDTSARVMIHLRALHSTTCSSHTAAHGLRQGRCIRAGDKHTAHCRSRWQGTRCHGSQLIRVGALMLAWTYPLPPKHVCGHKFNCVLLTRTYAHECACERAKSSRTQLYLKTRVTLAFGSFFCVDIAREQHHISRPANVVSISLDCSPVPRRCAC